MQRLGFQLVKHTKAHIQIRIGIVIDIHRPNKGFARVKVKLFHLVLPRLMHIDCVFVQQHGYGKAIHLPDHTMVLWIGDVNDHKIFSGSRAQADFAGGKILR